MYSRVGSRPRAAETVVLNVYRMNAGAEWLESLGIGLYHSGLEVHGKEWTFSSGGVFSHAPREPGMVQFSHAVVIGEVRLSSKQVEDAVSRLRADYAGSSYNLLKKNCNVFANDLSMALTGKAVPGYVNRLARLGACFSCLLPNELRDQSPVNEFDSVGGSGGVARRAQPLVASFTGVGRSLASSSSSSPASSAANSESAPQTAAERRRLMAAAAASRRLSNSKD